MDPSASFNRRRWSRLIIALGLSLFLIGLSATFGSAHRAAADDGCNTDEAVACIPLPPATNPGPQPSSAGAAAAAPAPSIACFPGSPLGCCGPYAAPGVVVPNTPVVPAPPNCCYPPPPDPFGPPVPIACCGPTPLPAIAAPPAMPSVPVPPPPSVCPSFRGIYAAINLANAADVHALRTLSTDGLSRYWSGDALAMLQGQVADLENRGVYATPRLVSIQVESGGFTGPGSAVVHTMEHWLYQERSLDSGVITFSQDQRVANEYDLSYSNGAWSITYNTATLSG